MCETKTVPNQNIYYIDMEFVGGTAQLYFNTRAE